MRLKGKHILVGVSGSISAYKAADLCRLLVKEGAEVQVIMTSGASDFITPLTLSVVSGNPVDRGMINENLTWNNHVAKALWADLFIIAPASANTISHLANGSCTELLHAVFLSARCPVMIAPAMDHDMFLHPATTANISTLESRHTRILGPVYGELASGLTGEGRLMEPPVIVEEVCKHFQTSRLLKGKRIMVTAGPTREPIDAVRYISNHSTGKMGVALASEFRDRGADVTLISGPIDIKIPGGIHNIRVVTGEEMHSACLSVFSSCDVAVMSAAVADYMPQQVVAGKIKKEKEDWSLLLKRSVDILSDLGKKKQHQLLVGFALESANGVENAQSKLKNKNLDLIVLNSLEDKGAGFGGDTNKITLIDTYNNVTEYPLKPKTEVASDIANKISEMIHA